MLGENYVLSLGLVLFLLLLSAFFSACEASFLSVQRVRLAAMVKARVPGADRVAHFLEQPYRFLATIITGNNLGNFTAAALVTAMAVALLGREKGVIVSALTVTVVFMLLGDMVPKVIASRHAEPLALFSAPLLGLFSRLFYPVVVSMGWLSSLLGRSSPISTTAITEAEFRTLVSMAKGKGIEVPQAELLERVFKFGDRQVKEVMTPRPDIVWIEAENSFQDFLAIYARHPHSAYPVYRGDMENVAGVLYIQDVLQALGRGPINGLLPLLHPPHFVPETKAVSQLLPELRRSGARLALSVDEFGVITGLVTQELLLEEVFGLEAKEEGFSTLGEAVTEVEGGMLVEEANERLGLGLPQGNYETVAGFILAHMGHIPREGEEWTYGPFHWKVLQMKGRRIEKALLTRLGNATPSRHL